MKRKCFPSSYETLVSSPTKADIKKLTSEVNQKMELKKIVRSVEAEKEGWKENIERMPKALAQIKR
jgi:hypothetical protein